jgi:putative NADPH-quinone reductase
VKAVVVVANPDSRSFTHAIAQRAEQALRAAGHDTVVRDLYAEGFTAAMSTAERAAYHSGTPVLSDQVAEHIELVRTAEALVFIYPTWWSGLPAILKGWLERVMVPGVAFGFTPSGKVGPQLTGVRHLVGISTYGAPWWTVKAVNDNGRRVLMRTLRLSTGWGTHRHWLGLYRIERSDQAARQAFLDRVERELARL